METSVLALAVAVIVVLVLLMSCWKSEEPPVRRTRSDYLLPDMKDVDYQLSDTGSGLKNRQLSHQYRELIKGDVPVNNYADAIKHMSLEPEVFSSHDDYAWDVGIANQGPSKMTVLDTEVDINPRFGPRKISYAVPIGDSARTQPSEYHDQMNSHIRTGHI